MDMEKSTKQYIIAAVAVIAAVGIVLGGLVLYSGMYPPFSVINSGSMMHSDDSSIGTIDTGDMVIVQDPDKKDIVTYVEGATTGYSKFGEYGDVIIYRDGNRNIIHRAMLELTLQSSTIVSQTWSIPSLIGYDDWDIVDSSGNSIKYYTWNETNGTLTLLLINANARLQLTDVGYGNTTCSVTLWNMGQNMEEGQSGYLTKGDNARTNPNFDQSLGITDSLVTPDRVQSIASVEIPWIGCIKLLFNGNIDQIPGNSIFCLIASIIGLIIAIFAINYAIERYLSKKNEE